MLDMFSKKRSAWAGAHNWHRPLRRALILAAAVGVWLVLTVHQEHDRRLFFGLWRLDISGPRRSDAWLTVAVLWAVAGVSPCMRGMQVQSRWGSPSFSLRSSGCSVSCRGPRCSAEAWKHSAAKQSHISMSDVRLIKTWP